MTWKSAVASGQGPGTRVRSRPPEADQGLLITIVSPQLASGSASESSRVDCDHGQLQAFKAGSLYFRSCPAACMRIHLQQQLLIPTACYGQPHTIVCILPEAFPIQLRIYWLQQ